MPNRHVYSLKLLTPVKVQIYSIGLERAKSACNFTKNSLIFGCRNPACRQQRGKPWHKYFGKNQLNKTLKTMWQEEDNKLKKSFSFKDFRAAFAFMNKVADVVNEMDHHPYWTNMYNKVSFELNTHDAGDTVTEKDHKLAAAIDRIYNA